ncbi:hemolysin family protein, partial [Limnospira fusiformis]|uniref:hemolysin family protein n=1 Tax=Limnospira fusiformis TaxID=54297 RepID=UPI002AA1C887|nr:hemolysin family protein [Limnospira fusiformis LS22]
MDTSSLGDLSGLTLTAQDIFGRLLSVFLLIAVNAFFVTAEFSMVSVRRSRISQLVDEGDLPAITVQQLQRRIDLLLSTTQFGITLSSLALGWIGESTMAVVIRQILNQIPLYQFQGWLAHSLSISIVTFFMLAYLQIVLGELVPKSLALLYPEQIARMWAPYSLAIARIFKPFVWCLNQSTRLLLRLLGINYTGQPYTRVTPEELQLIITTSSESMGLEAEERQLLNNVFEFGDVLTEEVMIPRTSIVSLPHTATFQNLLEEMAVSNHSRYPITGESLDDILGILDFRDLAKPLAERQLDEETPILTWVRAARFVSEQMLLSELLPLIQRSQQEMAIVVDEFGGTAGLVTIDDLISEIIGNGSELAEGEDGDIKFVDDQTFLVQAQLDVEEVNELLNLDLPLNEEYQTLGGFLTYQLQKIPAVGEVLTYHNLEFKVVLVEGPRLEQIQISQLGPKTTSDAELTIAELLESPDSQDREADSLTAMDEITPLPDNDTPKISDNSPSENSEVDYTIAELLESPDSQDREADSLTAMD